MIDAYVIGGSLPGLAAALELAEVGLRVRVGEWPQSADLAAAHAGASALVGPEPNTADAGGALGGLLGHLEVPVAAAADAPRVLLRGARGAWAPQPVPAVLGIPAVPISSDAMAVLGGKAATRAYLDRVKPVLTIGKTHALGDLVRSRLGGVALERLVEPIVRERFGLPASEVEVAAAAPGLNEALTRAGSLTGAVLDLQDRDVARETPFAPRDGWAAAMNALRERLAFFEVEFAETPVVSVVATSADSKPDAAWTVEEEGSSPIEVRALVPAIDAGTTAEALGLLGAATDESRSEELFATLTSTLPALLPTRWRYEVSVPLAGAGTAASVPREQAQYDSLETVHHEAAGEWSLRIVREANDAAKVAGTESPLDQTRAVLTSSVITAEADRAGLPSSESMVSVAHDLLVSQGCKAAIDRSATVTLRIAPAAEVELRDAANERMTELREQRRDLLAIGAALHSGDTAEAVADARSAAVQLRRRLTGISD